MEKHTPNSLSTAGIIDAAADLIEARGWATGPHGWSIAEGKGVCLEGAILAAMGRSRYGHDFLWFEREFRQCPAYAAVALYARDTHGHTEELWRFNDRQATQAPVVALLRGAAAMLRSGVAPEVARIELPALTA